MNDAIATVEGILAGRVGLRVDSSLRSRLARCVDEEATAAGLSVERYAAQVDADPGAFQRLLNRVTVQHTSFFRNPEPYLALSSLILPELQEPVVAWSAGCANGQEAYSLAMVLEESGLKDWRVLGTDVSSAAIARARAGTYTDAEARSLGDERRRIHMRPVGQRWEVAPALRRRVEFHHHNLAGDPRPQALGACQVIFCRNVLIYFDPQQLGKVLDRFASWIDPEGYLFLGSAESLWQLTDRFRLTRVAGAFAYRPATAGSEPPERRQREAAPVSERRHLPGAAELLAAGEAAAAAGDYVAAATAFRLSTVVDPDQPVTHFQLGLCLERLGRRVAARQSFEAARAALERSQTSRFEAALQGFRPDELIRAIELRLGESG
jgi:chemotaxis protein methyltransferase CheR